MDRTDRDSTDDRTKACCLTATLWVGLVIIGVLCFADVSDDVPTDWFKQLRVRRMEFAVLRRTTRQANPTTQTTKRFELPFKTLYVFGKIPKSVDSNFTKQPEQLLQNNIACRTSATDQPLQNTSNCSTPATVEHQPIIRQYIGVGKELCASSGIDEDNVFYCSELLPSGDNIFFLETSCAGDQETDLGTAPPLSEKQSCAVYSAGLHNPSRKVILLFTCPVPTGYNWTKEWTTLFDLPNFHFGRVVLADLYANTSLSDFYHGPLNRSDFKVSHQSDLLRQFALYLYGGTYMDLDVITFKPLDGLGTNYLIHQGDDLITAGVWNVEPGHPFLRKCLFTGVSNYDPKNFPTIGPNLYTDTFKSLCNYKGKLEPNTLMNFPSCNLRVLPMTTFFSVNYLNWEMFYKCNLWSTVENMTRESYGVHYWNHKGNLVLHVGSKQPLVKFAQKHCPPVYYNAGLTLS